MFLQKFKNLNFIYIVSFVMLFIGSIIGGVYFLKLYPNSSDVADYLNSYVTQLKDGINTKAVIISSIKEYGILSLLILISGFFKFGPLISFFLLIRKSFVMSFTLSAMISEYGLKGIIYNLHIIPQALLTMPVLMFFISVGACYSVKHSIFNKKEKFIYIIFSILVFTIFCVSALAEGFLSTIFYKWLISRVT